MSEKPSINPQVNGAYAVKGVNDLRNSKGERIDTDPEFELCACGGSGNKPFCDGTHRKTGFSSRKEEGRLPGKVDTYAGKAITIYDNSSVCTGAGFCVKNAPGTFDPERKPWIDPDIGDAGEIAAAIRLCPSGALSYRKGDEYYKDQDREPSVSIARDGPYNIVGGIELNDPQGSKPESGEHYSLCRCGASGNKPFCDGSHGNIGFKDASN